METKLDCTTWCLAQVSCRDYTAVFDMRAIKDPEVLAPILEDRGILKICHNATMERGVCRKHGINLYPVFDTLKHSRLLRGRGAGHDLGAVAMRELDIKLKKTFWNADWTQRPIPREQFYYAVLDAEVLIEIHQKFMRELRMRRIRPEIG